MRTRRSAPSQATALAAAACARADWGKAAVDRQGKDLRGSDAIEHIERNVRENGTRETFPKKARDEDLAAVGQSVRAPMAAPK